MEEHLRYVDPVTPTYNVNLWKSEDSGYHTSYTPSSIENSQISHDHFDRSVIPSRVDSYNSTPESNLSLRRKRNHSKTLNESPVIASPIRRNIKRCRVDSSTSDADCNLAATPTTLIAGKIKSLEVCESKENVVQAKLSMFSECSGTLIRDIYQIGEQIRSSYPTTPVKKNCGNSCKRSPRSAFAIHSLSCDSQGLQPLKKHRSQNKVVRTILFLPEKKIDIISRLYSGEPSPPLSLIFDYLSNEDIHNFGQVSSLWYKIRENALSTKKKHEYLNYLRSAKENQENKEKGNNTKANILTVTRSLREIQNEIHNVPNNNAQISPPVSPKTNRFRKFSKSASLDLHIISCIRCSYPAKVTKEETEEEWAECTSATCSYSFCRLCNCDRHPGKICFQYDLLSGPSPSKRKKIQYGIGTKKSKRNLLRTLMN